MEGSVIWDTISQLDFYMTDGSNLTGAIIDDESFAGNGGDGYCNVYVSDDSTWTVTGDSTVSKLSMPEPSWMTPEKPSQLKEQTEPYM